MASDMKIEEAWDNLDTGKWSLGDFLDNVSYFPEQIGKSQYYPCWNELNSSLF